MLDMHVHWTLNLSPTQLNMVLRSLRGCLRAEEVEDAKGLANIIASKRVSITKNKLDAIDKLEQNLGEGNG